MGNLFNYLILTYSFYNVLAIRPCDVRQVPFKLKSRDIISAEKSAVNNRPLLQESVSTIVNLSLSINDLNILDIKNLDIEIDLGMTKKWYDHRLAPDYRTQKLAVLGAIWQPKITFVIGNKCSTDISTAQNDQTEFFRGTSNGSVFHSERFFVKPKCTKDLTKYPFDVQTCILKIGSYRFTAEEVSLKWNIEMPVELRVKKELGEFLIEKLNTYDEIDTRTSGNFSILILEINLTRYSRREIIQTFIPSFIFVKMAYGVFWMKLSEIRTRILTCQFSLIGMLFLFTNSNNYSVSNLTYLKAIDIWFLICTAFVILPLAESIFLHYYNKEEEEKEEENFEGEVGFEIESEVKSARKIALWIDKISSLLHPIGLLSSTILFFISFNNDESY